MSNVCVCFVLCKFVSLTQSCIGLLQKEMSIILAARVEDVLKSAFEDGLPALALPQTDVASKL